jgi:hypothetical protein
MQRIFAFLLVLPAIRPAATAQDMPVAGPVLGYVWDAASARLRPILGIPGSSLLGEAPDLGVTLSLAEVSPRQDYVIGVEAGSGAVVLVSLAGSRAGVAAVAGLGPGAERIALSPTGAAAAVYGGSGGLSVVTGLPEAPATRTLAAPGRLTALAVSDSGERVLAVSGEQLYLLARGAEPRLLGPVGAGAAIAFVENSGDALVADPARQEAFLVRGEGERLILAGAREGISDPVAAAVAGRRGLVANRGTNTVLLLDLAGGAPAAISCSCEVAGLQRLRGDAVFRLTGSLHAPSYLLEAGQPEPRLWFVPPDARALVRPPRERSR